MGPRPFVCASCEEAVMDCNGKSNCASCSKSYCNDCQDDLYIIEPECIGYRCRGEDGRLLDKDDEVELTLETFYTSRDEIKLELEGPKCIKLECKCHERITKLRADVCYGDEYTHICEKCLYRQPWELSDYVPRKPQPLLKDVLTFLLPKLPYKTTEEILEHYETHQSKEQSSTGK